MLILFENCIFVCVLITSLSVLFTFNTVQSLLWLITTFILMIFEFLVLGTEFVALLFLMIYIGAIAVLFLFVIMMLNIRVIELSSIYIKYWPIGSFILFFFIIEVTIFLYKKFINILILSEYLYVNWVHLYVFKGNIYILGNIFFTYYSLYFCLLGLILFIAMIGCIVLLMYFESKKIVFKVFENINFIKFYKMKQ